MGFVTTLKTRSDEAGDDVLEEFPDADRSSGDAFAKREAPIVRVRKKPLPPKGPPPLKLRKLGMAVRARQGSRQVAAKQTLATIGNPKRFKTVGGGHVGARRAGDVIESIVIGSNRLSSSSSPQ